MELTGISKLNKLKKKNRGNNILCKEIDELILVIENSNWKIPLDVKNDRIDAECVHSEGFYFFDIEHHRTMILLEFIGNEASIVWVGSHDKYMREFKNNKDTIAEWLKSRGFI